MSRMRIEGGPAKPVVLVNPSGNIQDVSQNAILIVAKDNEGIYRPVELDSISGAIVTVDFSHHEIHEGHHFNYNYAESLDAAATAEYLLTTPDTDKFIHMLFNVGGSAITQVDIYEDSTRTGTTAQTVFNNNRNSLIAASLIIHKGIGGAGDGTLIFTYKGGAALGNSKTPTDARGDSEIILKKNSKYLIRITSGTADNLTNLHLEWYEHTAE